VWGRKNWILKISGGLFADCDKNYFNAVKSELEKEGKGGGGGCSPEKLA
jgi:hypothetical protein